MSSEEKMDELILPIREWLGERGINHFRRIQEEHGCINAVWNEGGIPHCVHFREGMQIRNKLRELTNYSWTDHEYDDNWTAIVERAIEEYPPLKKTGLISWLKDLFVLRRFRDESHPRSH